MHQFGVQKSGHPTKKTKNLNNPIGFSITWSGYLKVKCGPRLVPKPGHYNLENSIMLLNLFYLIIQSGYLKLCFLKPDRVLRNIDIFLLLVFECIFIPSNDSSNMECKGERQKPDRVYEEKRFFIAFLSMVPRKRGKSSLFSSFMYFSIKFCNVVL